MKSAVQRLLRAYRQDYVDTPPAGIVVGSQNKQRACEWPDCNFIAVREMGMGVKQPKRFICAAHSPKFRELDIGHYDRMDWQPKRYWKDLW